MFNVILVTDSPGRPKWARGNGAHRLANHLRESGGYSCLVVDFASDMTWDNWCEICDQAIGDSTLVLGISTTWWPYRNPHTNQMVPNLDGSGIIKKQNTLAADATNGKLGMWIEQAKKRNPKLKILVGGPKLDNYVDIPADHFIVGYGETETLDYVNSLQERRRIWPRFVNHDRNADNFSFITSKTTYTEYDFVKPDEFLTVEFTRGCRFKCSFCSYPLIGRKNILEKYFKTPETIYAEFMENYDRWGVTHYQVADDTFNDSLEKLQVLYSITSRLPFKLKLKAYTRLDVAATHPEMIPLLKEIGLRNTWIGLDSMHPVGGKAIGKGMNPERKKDALRQIKSIWGDEVYTVAGYIVGLPGEGTAALQETVDWICAPDSPIHELKLNPLRINPPSTKYPNASHSDMDRNYTNYGYSIPDLDKPWLWVKNDGTDIQTFQDAVRVTTDIMSKIVPTLNQPYDYNFAGIQDPQIEYFQPLISKLKGE
jgi:hypothetical protein